MYFNIAEMDLIASEFKLHKECRKMLTRSVRFQADTARHIHSHVIDLDHPLGMGTAVKLYLGSDTDEASGETMKKRRQRLKKKLLDH